MSAAVDRAKRFWETLSPQTLEGLAEVYADDVHFRDPFNELHGVAALRELLDDMFVKLEAPAFRIVDVVEDAGGAVLAWDFEFRIRAVQPKRVRRIHGVSHLRFAPDGRVAWHRDYWDAAGELYAQLPVIGALMRFLARRLGHSSLVASTRLRPACLAT